MKFKLPRTPLLIAAIATAVMLGSYGPASAKSYWASAKADQAEVIDANFKLKFKKHKSFKHHKPHHVKPYHGHVQHHGFKKKEKKHVSKHYLKKKLLLKKLY